MPASKLSFKENHLKLEVEGLEFTVGHNLASPHLVPDIIKVEKLTVELDVNDLLRAKLPALVEGRPAGIAFISYGSGKIQCAKAVRAFTGCSLAEAKELVEMSPNGFIDTAGKKGSECESFCNVILNEGGKAELVRSNQTIPSVMDMLREMLSEALGKAVQ